MIESKIVAATGAATGAATLSKEPQSLRIQDAMTEAIKQAHKEGITDPKEIKTRMMAAREAVKKM